jgi:hypothetical protein
MARITPVTAIMPRPMRAIGGFQIKRAEKYFVFTSMSRKERLLPEKMAPFAA